MARTYTCAGLPGKPCKTIFVGEIGFVPPFNQIAPGRLTEQQVIGAALCDDCGRRYPKLVGAPRMYSLLKALAIVGRSASLSPCASLGDVLAQKEVRERLQGQRVEAMRLARIRRRQEREHESARFIATAARVSSAA